MTTLDWIGVFLVCALCGTVGFIVGFILGADADEVYTRRQIRDKGFVDVSQTERIVGRIERLEWPEGKK